MINGNSPGTLGPSASRGNRARRYSAFTTSLVTISTLFLAGCGGGQAEKSAPPLEPSQVTPRNIDTPTLQGRFIDSAVSGLFYRSETTEGFTDHNGYFHYAAGETVSFHIGSIALGSAGGAHIVTPADLSASRGNHDAVVNVLRLLQTLDEDGDPGNGISITSRTHLVASQFADDAIRVDTDAESFAQNPSLLKLIGEVTNLSGLIPVEPALAHVQQSQQALGLEYTP